MLRSLTSLPALATRAPLSQPLIAQHLYTVRLSLLLAFQERHHPTLPNPNSDIGYLGIIQTRIAGQHSTQKMEDIGIEYKGGTAPMDQISSKKMGDSSLR